jgi:hypothetical protein
LVALLSIIVNHFCALEKSFFRIFSIFFTVFRRIPSLPRNFAAARAPARSSASVRRRVAGPKRASYPAMPSRAKPGI